MQSGPLQPEQFSICDSFTAASDRRTAGQKAGMLDESLALAQCPGDMTPDL